jgi:hypothetical protein
MGNLAFSSDPALARQRTCVPEIDFGRHREHLNIARLLGLLVVIGYECQGGSATSPFHKNVSFLGLSDALRCELEDECFGDSEWLHA